MESKTAFSGLTYPELLKLSKSHGIDLRQGKSRKVLEEKLSTIELPTIELPSKIPLTKTKPTRKAAAKRGPILTLANLYHYSDIYEHSFLLPLHEFGYYGSKTKTIASGAFGIVNLYDKGGETYAIKIPKKVTSRGKGLPPTDFIIEAAIMVRMKHPNITPILDVVSDTLSVGLVMPVAQMNLALIKYQSLPMQRKKYYTYAILCGLSYMHSRYIVHHDLKLSNVLLFDNGTPEGIAKLSDFGSVKPFACEPANVFGNGAFTPYYRAPESIITNGSIIGTASDIWAMGLMIYHIFAAKPHLWPGNRDPESALIEISKVLGPITQKWPQSKHLSTEITNWNNLESKFVSGDITSITKNIKSKIVIDVILNALKYDPAERSTAYDMLSSPYFNKIRIKENEYENIPCELSLRMRDRHVKYSPGTPKPTKYVNKETRSTILNIYANITMTQNRHIKTYLVAVDIFDSVHQIAKPNTLKSLHELMFICYLIADEISERKQFNLEAINKILNIHAIIRLNQADISNLKVRILKMLKYDLIQTTSYDYYVKNDNMSNWGLVKALIILMSHNNLWFSMSKEDIFDMCIALTDFYANNQPLDEMKIKLVPKLLEYNLSEYKHFLSLFVLYADIHYAQFIDRIRSVV